MIKMRVRSRDFSPEVVDPAKVADKSIPDDQLTSMERRLRSAEDKLDKITAMLAKRPDLVNYEFVVNRGKNDRITTIDAMAKPVGLAGRPAGRLN
jgi:hypothetical protein